MTMLREALAEERHEAPAGGCKLRATRVMRPTPGLRFVDRTVDGATTRVLQQLWHDIYSGHAEWRDVPTGIESPAGADFPSPQR